MVYRDAAGGQRRVIERVRYVDWSGGRPVFVAQPLVRHYELSHYHGVPLAYYRPRALRAGLLPQLLPAFRGAGVHRCRGRRGLGGLWRTGHWLQRSGDADGRSADLVRVRRRFRLCIALGRGVGFRDAQRGGIGDNFSKLQDKVDARVQHGDGALGLHLVGVAWRPRPVDQAMGGAPAGANFRGGAAADAQTGGPERGDAAERRAPGARRRAAARYACIYLFQAAQPLDVTDLSSGGACFLNTGDLLVLSRPPTATVLLPT